MPYRYFAEPYKFSTYTNHPLECDICGEEAPGYRGPFRGEEDIDFVCEECLVDGGLAEADVIANAGDMEALRSQLQELHPGSTPERIAQMVEKRYSELAERTPPACMWSFFLWPAHCGDFSRLEKEVGQADIIDLAGEHAPREWLALHLAPGEAPPGTTLDAEKLWAQLRPDSPENNEKTYDTTALLFRCLECGRETIVAGVNPT